MSMQHKQKHQQTTNTDGTIQWTTSQLQIIIKLLYNPVIRLPILPTILQTIYIPVCQVKNSSYGLKHHA